MSAVVREVGSGGWIERKAEAAIVALWYKRSKRAQ